MTFSPVHCFVCCAPNIQELISDRSTAGEKRGNTLFAVPWELLMGISGRGVLYTTRSMRTVPLKDCRPLYLCGAVDGTAFDVWDRIKHGCKLCIYHYLYGWTRPGSSFPIIFFSPATPTPTVYQSTHPHFNRPPPTARVLSTRIPPILKPVSQHSTFSAF